MSKGLLLLLSSLFVVGVVGVGTFVYFQRSENARQVETLTPPQTNSEITAAIETVDPGIQDSVLDLAAAELLFEDLVTPLSVQVSRLATSVQNIQVPPATVNTTYQQTLSQNNVSLSNMSRQLVYALDVNTLVGLEQGSSGQFLMSNGPGAVPSWQSVGGSSGIGNFTSVMTAGATTPLTVGTGGPFQVNNLGRLDLAYVGDSGWLSSSGGVIFIDNTNNIGTGIGIYSNADGSAEGNMINVKVDNPLYNQAAFYMNYDGLSNAVEIVSNSNDSSSNALAVTGNNINDSTVGIIGYELGKGTIKVTHNRPGSGNDQNASGLSIDLKGVGTRAQGVYVDSTETGGTLGNLLRLRNQSIDQFVVGPQGNLTLTGNITQGATGTNTTFTKNGNVSGDQFFVGTTGAFRVQRSAGNSEAFRVQVNGDTQGRWLGTSDGQLKWGDGASAQDVVMYRTGVSRLALEGSMTFNNLNADNDTVIKGMTDSNLLFVDASANAIGIGISSPTSPLHINKSTASEATLYVNQTGAGDIFNAAASGTSRFRVTNAGNFVTTAGTGWRPATDAVNGLNIQKADGTPFTYFDTTNSRVGIGTSTPGAPLHVFGGDIWLENNQALRIKDSGGSARSVLAYTSGNNVQLYNYATTGVVQIGINNVSNTGGIRFFTNANTERVRIDPGGLGVGATAFGTGAVNVLAIASSTAPSTSITDGIQLFAVDVGGSHELQVRDEAGNVTTLSPHNFSLIPQGQSEPLAWAYYSQFGNTAVNIDMTRAIRIVEQLSGQQLIYTKNLSTPNSLASVLGTTSNVWEDDLNSLLEAQKQYEAKYLAKKDLENKISLDDGIVSILSQLVVKAKATFEGATTFLAGVVFKGPITVNSDTAGVAEIPVGATQVKISFSQAFEQAPQVYLSPNQEITGGYTLRAVTPTSFEITLNQPQSETKQIQWLAVMSQGGAPSTVEIISSEAPESIEPTASPESSPVLLPSSEASQAAQASTP